MTTLLRKVDYAKTLWATWFGDHNLAKADDVFFMRAQFGMRADCDQRFVKLWRTSGKTE
jgi:hypothetical protein